MNYKINTSYEYIISFIFLGIIISSCSSTNSLTLSVTQAPSVLVSSKIKSIGIIDRSLPTEKDKAMDKIDKILTAEGKNLDKDGAHEAVLGLFEELNNTNRFSEIKIIDNLDLRSTGVGVFPSALSSERIEQICKDNNVDAIFALSFYDTDAQVDYKAIPVEIDGPMGLKIPAIEHHATIITDIKTGWRIYDQVNKSIADEFLVNEQVVSVGKGINPINAVQAIIGRKAAVLEISRNIGQNYALRIIPYNMRVSRDYYVKGTDNFKIAKRRAQTGNWDGAAKLWNMEVNNTKVKIAGRACYNMAIINEINGNLDKAIEWASKSYTDYYNKLALKYVNILKSRIRENEELEMLLNN